MNHAEANSKKALLLYIPGMDWRRIDVQHAPYLAGLVTSFPSAAVTSYPSVELLSTVITGLRPHEHGIWQARLTPPRSPTPVQQLIDALPDAVTTTAQCLARGLTGRGQMCTIPPRRRRQLKFERMKFYGRVETEALLAELASHGVRDSLLTAVGPKRCRYIFTDRLTDQDWLLREFGAGARALEVVQFHPLDIMGHWYLETPEEFRQCYRLADALVKRFHEKCRAHGVTMVFLSDHGQERVTTRIDLTRVLRRLPVSEREYTLYVESMKARFWFQTDRARRTVNELLANSPHGTLLSYRQMHQYGVEFPDAAYGESYFMAHPGSVFFPDDFYHPLVNLFFGVKMREKRKRLWNPTLRGQHGYLPIHDSERGLMIVLDDACRADASAIELRDAAPTILHLLGERIPAFMKGTPRFHRNGNGNVPGTAVTGTGGTVI